MYCVNCNQAVRIFLWDVGSPSANPQNVLYDADHHYPDDDDNDDVDCIDGGDNDFTDHDIDN